MKALGLAVLLATAVTLAGCSQSSDEAKPQGKVVPPTIRQTEQTFPVGSTWSAVSLGGRSFSGEHPSFSLDQAFRGRGFGGCNNYSATVYPLRQQTLAVGPIAVTKKACPGGSGMEGAFLAALRSAQKWDIKGSTLIIHTGNGELRFNRTL